MRRTDVRGGARDSGRRRRRDSGAAFIEFALLVPVLTLFAMGLVEYGTGWKWANDVNAAARDAGRTGTSEPVYLTSDRSVLLTVGTSLTAQELENVKRVIVFKASDAQGKVPQSCKGLENPTGSSAVPGSKRGVSSTCNVYGKGQIDYVLAHPSDDTPWVNSAGKDCDNSDVDQWWCPAKRNRNLTTDTFDYIGVYLEVEKPSTTNFGFGKMTIERTAVFQLEPAFGGN